MLLMVADVCIKVCFLAFQTYDEKKRTPIITTVPVLECIHINPISEKNIIRGRLRL